MLAIALAFVFGCSFTLLAVRPAGLDFKSAIKVALAAGNVSIAAMELVDSMIIALARGHWTPSCVAFLAATPVNK